MGQENIGAFFVGATRIILCVGCPAGMRVGIWCRTVCFWYHFGWYMDDFTIEHNPKRDHANKKVSENLTKYYKIKRFNLDRMSYLLRAPP